MGLSLSFASAALQLLCFSSIICHLNVALATAAAKEDSSYNVTTIQIPGIHPYYLSVASQSFQPGGSGEAMQLIIDTPAAAIYRISLTRLDSPPELFAGQPGVHGWADGHRIDQPGALLHSPSSLCQVSGLEYIDYIPVYNRPCTQLSLPCTQLSLCMGGHMVVGSDQRKPFLSGPWPHRWNPEQHGRYHSTQDDRCQDGDS